MCVKIVHLIFYKLIELFAFHPNSTYQFLYICNYSTFQARFSNFKMTTT
jgi:hypothetical protein